MDLTPYIARGFPGEIDASLAAVAVAGLDKWQAQSMVRLCEATSDYLYRPATPIQYQHGQRQVLEKIASTLTGDRVSAAMNWVQRHLQHPHHFERIPPDRAMTEEHLIKFGVGWCNEQVRVFIALCEVMDYPARLVFLFHKNRRCQHTAAEVFMNGRWVFHDVTFALRVKLPDGTFANAREIHEQYRDLANQQYEQPLRDYYARMAEWTRDCPGWGTDDRPATDRAGELFDSIGICEYLIDGCIQADQNGND